MKGFEFSAIFAPSHTLRFVVLNVLGFRALDRCFLLVELIPSKSGRPVQSAILPLTGWSSLCYWIPFL